MIKKICKFLLVSLSLVCPVIFSSCLSTNNINKAPVWVTAPRNVYPYGDYLIYVGYGPDRNSAEVSALSGISAIFGQDVTVDTNASKRMTEAIADGIVASSQNRSFSQDIVKKVNVDNLIGVETKEFWFDGKDTWYAIAVLDKNKALEIYSSIITKNEETVDALVATTKKDFYSLQSMSAFDFAQEIAIDNKKNIDKLFVINSEEAELLKRKITSPEELASKKLEIAKKIPVNVFISGDYEDTYKSAFLDALADFGFSGSASDDVRYAIKGKVSYNYEYTSDGKTAKCYYDLESSFFDTHNNIEIFPVNIRGRQAHRSMNEAKNRVKTDIISKIESSFDEEFNNYLGGYLSK